MINSRAGFIALDWGTSSFRLWHFGDGGKILAERRSEDGMAQIKAGGFASILQHHLDAIAADPNLPIVAAGMVGARQGWKEAPYAEMGYDLRDLADHALTFSEAGLKISIIPGIAKHDQNSPDVMRGEETQLLGAALLSQQEKGLYCLPGTHSKWVKMEGFKIADFSTFMTGEIFALLRQHSILRFLYSGEPKPIAPSPAFFRGVQDGYRQPSHWLTLLFKLRASALLFGDEGTNDLERLSGLLIGMEIAGAADYLSHHQVTRLIGASALTHLYRVALRELGYSAEILDGDLCVRTGLAHLAKILNQLGE